MLNFSSIVLNGNFNPAIFHPEWFERFKILPIQEIQWADRLNTERDEVEFRERKLKTQSSPPPLIVTHDYSNLNFQSLKIEVHQERFDCKAYDRKNFSLIKEVTLKIFSLLEHTPVKGVGINFEGHWRFEDDALTILKNLFGKKNKTFEDIFGESYNISGRIMSETEDCQLRIDINKSKVFDNSIFFTANFHRDIDTKRSEDALKIINIHYDNDLNEIIKINKKLLGDPKEIYEQ
ncbi:MAG: hypothetical protein GY795_21425 [Desulfobacterales bacterium]|nr:hypothetical protein [Desulfobacterales bacterium]